MSQYNPDSWTRPTPNLQFLVWLFVLGLPALMLFLVFSKTQSEELSPKQPIPHARAVHQ